MATNANEVLDRLAALLDAATPGPWAYDDGVTDGDRATGERGKHPWVTTRTGRMVCQPDGGPLCDDAGCPTIAEMDANSDLIVALRNAAPALFRLARSAAILADDPRYEYGRVEFNDAVKALGEVRL